jgi:hypothetical protein
VGDIDWRGKKPAMPHIGYFVKEGRRTVNRFAAGSISQLKHDRAAYQ